MGRNDWEAGDRWSGGRKKHHNPSPESDNSDTPDERDTRGLNSWEATIFSDNGLLVLRDWRLPSGWKIVCDDTAILPLPEGRDFQDTVAFRMSLMTPEERNKPGWDILAVWRRILEKKRPSSGASLPTPIAGTDAG